jgi:hypothetical protein
MDQITIENYLSRIKYGEPFMKKLSEVAIKDIVGVIEKIWENSCGNFYDTIGNGEYLKKAYADKTITVEYNSNLDIETIIVKWSFYDQIKIELSAYGLTATYKPEHGQNKIIYDITWVLVNSCFQN